MPRFGAVWLIKPPPPEARDEFERAESDLPEPDEEMKKLVIGMIEEDKRRHSLSDLFGLRPYETVITDIAANLNTVPEKIAYFVAGGDDLDEYYVDEYYVDNNDDGVQVIVPGEREGEQQTVPATATTYRRLDESVREELRQAVSKAEEQGLSEDDIHALAQPYFDRMNAIDNAFAKACCGIATLRGHAQD